MNYFLGLVLLFAGTIMGAFAIDNIVALETLSILNTTMILCSICGLGFAGLLLYTQTKNQKVHSKIQTWDDDDD